MLKQKEREKEKEEKNGNDKSHLLCIIPSSKQRDKALYIYKCFSSSRVQDIITTTYNNL